MDYRGSNYGKDIPDWVKERDTFKKIVGKSEYAENFLYGETDIEELEERAGQIRDAISDDEYDIKTALGIEETSEDENVAGSSRE